MVLKCPICGKKTLPGAKLCTPCRSALKRAKDDSVWELPPGRGVAAPIPVDDPVASPRWVLGGRLSGWRGLAVGGAALFLAAGVFATVRMAHDETPARVGAAAVPATMPVAVPDAPPLAALTTPAVPVASPSTAAAALAPFVDDAVEPPKPHDRPVRPPKAARTVPEPMPIATPAPVADPLPAPPALATAPERATAPRAADPWQRMAEALARCGSQDLFGRLGCEHRVRATFCDGNWGQVAQCPGGVANNDHGQ